MVIIIIEKLLHQLNEVSTSLELKQGIFLNKTKFNYFSLASSFAVCNIILVYYLLVYKSKAKQGIIIQEYKFHGLGLLQFQNK